MLRNILALTLGIGLVGGSIGVASALFTDTQAVDSNTFSTGSVDIATNPTTALVSFSNMLPGDSVVAPITVTNSGTVEFRYSLTSTTTNVDTKGLMSQLDLTIVKVADTGACNADAFVSPAPADIMYATGDLGSLIGANLIGDPTVGADTGDRLLASSASEVLCFSVSLPDTTGNAYEDADTTATLDFAAEQTANND